ncbi:MAG: N-6 DNA methylase [Dehalococcoidia bacterium]|jgi:hypothetical protein
MPQYESLDKLVSQKAADFAHQIKAAAAMADNEEEIRIEVESQLALIKRDLGFEFKGKHEFTLASGRPDSVYSGVIIEYKNPKSPGNRIGERSDSPGSKKVVEQIKKRFYDMRHEHGQPMNSLLGVGLDGNYFIFVRFRDEKWQIQEPVEINRHSAERFLWALFNLGQKGKPYSPEYLAGDFGSEGGSTVAITGIHALYDAILTTQNPKAQTFFSQWKILFGEVCGYDVDNPTDKLRKLAEFYQVGIIDPKPAELLFSVHTYYALFMKLLAAEIVAFFHKLSTPLQKMMHATTSAKLKREMEDLETGSIFRLLNITNFLEGDLFAWYTGVWTEPIEQLVRDMVTRLDAYNPGTLSEDPSNSRDLLKKLYQQLFPKSVRHDLGEYYTPDWLAEHVLNELDYIGDPDKRLLDPACGSGTFLVMAINRIREWYDENRENCRFDEGELGHKILSNVIGFDLNPLAVMASRTNYLIAIRDLIGRMDKVEIPVYLCDSIMTPSEYGGLFAGKLGIAKELKTAPATFIIPAEIASNREDVAKYAEQLELCVRNGYSAEEFIQRCCDEGLPITEHQLHCGLYNELVKLDKANKNGVWARIIKNAFAPIFTHQVDYIAGNPPWVTWSSLPQDYRKSTTALWQKYDLFRHKGLRAQLGSSGDDISILMTYVSADNFLKNGGKLGFVITQSLFQSKGGGEGFRRFKINDTDYLHPLCVHDLVAINPFEGATNRTAVFIAQKNGAPIYPVPYFRWHSIAAKSLNPHMELKEVLNLCTLEQLAAEPISSAKDSSWQVTGKSYDGALRKAKGKAAYKARKGISTSANGVFWITVLRSLNGNKVLVQNMYDVGKKTIPSVQAAIESPNVYPLLRGRDIERWWAEASCYIAIAQDPTSPNKAITETQLRRIAPSLNDYFREFKDILTARKDYKKFFEPSGAPFYSLYNFGHYTMTPVKVLWRYIDTDFRCAVVEPIFDKNLERVTTILPDSKLVLIDLDNSDEAYFVCALLNSSPARMIVKSYVVGTQISTHILDSIKVPHYDPKNDVHKLLVKYSREAHKIVRNQRARSSILDNKEIDRIEAQIDIEAAIIWDMKRSELQTIQLALKTGASGAQDNNDSDDPE